MSVGNFSKKKIRTFQYLFTILCIIKGIQKKIHALDLLVVLIISSNLQNWKRKIRESQINIQGIRRPNSNEKIELTNTTEFIQIQPSVGYIYSPCAV